MAILASSSKFLTSPLYGNVQGDRHEQLQKTAVWRDLVTGEKIRDPIHEFTHGAQRVDILPPTVQLDLACQRLNRLQAIAERIPCLAVEEELRDSADLFEATGTGLVLEQSTWIVRSVPEVQIGQRVEIVGVQDPAMLPHVGKSGVVRPFRNYAVRGCTKVRLDGHVVDMIVPLVCCRAVISATATRLDALLEQHDALTRFRQQVLAKGEILQRKPEVFATIKKSRRVCGNVHSESGAKGYAFITVVQNGKRKRFSIQPSELGRYEAAYARGQEVKRFDRELKRLTRQIDRLTAIASGTTHSRLADVVGKQAGQLDIFCTRDGRAKKAGAAFSFVVFRWSTGKLELKRSNSIKRFPVAAGATTEQVESARQRAIAFLQTLQ